MTDILRFDGDQFVGGGKPRRWNGSAFVPSPYALEATGGVVTIVNDYTVHTFTNSGTFTVTAPGTVEYLLVGGGGSGSSGTAGGGGGGGVMTNENGVKKALAVGDYEIVVGQGGAAPGVVKARGNNGQNTTALGLTAFGGGTGGRTSDSAAVLGGTDGGSGGGGTNYGGMVGGAGLGVVGQGYNGAAALIDGGGGGGGAGSPAPTDSRDGGAGRLSTMAGLGIYYGGGGGGAHNATPGAGGIGGGGAGNGAQGGAGVVNTGGGGGGGWAYGGGLGGAGGSGIVIIRYLT